MPAVEALPGPPSTANTASRAVDPTRRTGQDRPAGRLSGVKTTGVDEHVWQPSTPSGKAVTVMVDLVVIGVDETDLRSWRNSGPVRMLRRIQEETFMVTVIALLPATGSATEIGPDGLTS